MITSLSVRWFKGLRSFKIAPGRVNLLIGANGTGKSNFADLIAFVGNLCSRGLVGAIEDGGGFSHVRTRQSGVGRTPKFHVEFSLGEDRSWGIHSVAYSFTLVDAKDDIRVQRESLEAVVYKRTRGRPALQGVPRFDYAQPIPLTFRREGSAVSEWSESLGPLLDVFDSPRELLLAAYSRLGELRTLSDYLSSWRVYNIDATVAKRSTGGSDVELERYGANIVPFIARMLENATARARLLDDLREAVPYIRDVEPDRVLSFQTLRFAEMDSGEEFQLNEMSDGTIRLLGLLAMLRQTVPPAVLVIEEPENALHSYAIQHFLRVARRVAMKETFASQVFFTSHSATVVDDILDLEATQETRGQTRCFITQRRPNQPNIVQAPESVMKAIAENLGRPSDFQREGSFGDQPVQLPLLTNMVEAK